MNKVRLPRSICGNWIWLKDWSKKDNFLLFRKEFNCDSIGDEADLWISANTAYQLFVNEQLAGFGPCAHHDPGACYIDQHDISFYLVPGKNVIAVRVYYNTDCSGEPDNRPPGLWCQVSGRNKEILCSDSSWKVTPASFSAGHRPLIGPGEGRTELFHSENCPADWMTPEFVTDSSWQNPDVVLPVDAFPLRPELYPMPPVQISPENPEFVPVCSGKVLKHPVWSGFVFRSTRADGNAVFAASAYILSETAADVECTVFSDDPFKFFCNRQLAAEGRNSFGVGKRILHLQEGWNRLLVVQTPEAASMGFMIIFPDDFSGKILQDTIDTAPAGWCCAGPLRLKLEESTPSLRFERQRVEGCVCGQEYVPVPDAVLERMVLEKQEKTADDPLESGSYRIWKLPRLGYGFVTLNIQSGIGDIVDVSAAPGCYENGFPGCAGKRTAGTLFCRGGNTVYTTFVPADCLYLGVYVRSTRSNVTVESVDFKMLIRDENRAANFRCSDELLNEFWQTGVNTLQRCMSFVPMADARRSQDIYLLDAFVDAVNAAIVYGDSVYAAVKLRAFLDSQLENGDIPALTHSMHRKFQLHHMLFLPHWIIYNYRFSGSVVELERSLDTLDFAREFFESMLDEKYGLLVFPANWHTADSRLSKMDFGEGRISCCLNALFCRFLLSAQEIYRIVGNRKGNAVHCFKLAGSIAARLREYCYDAEKGLFRSWVDQQEHDTFDCFCNFTTLYSGVMDAENFERFFYSFFNYDPPFEKDCRMTPYFSHLFTEMMFACSQRQWIYRYLRDYWSKHLDRESGSWDDRMTGFVNGAGISPNLFLIHEVLGIRRGDASQSVVYFHPGVDFVQSAEGAIAIGNGRLLVKWSREPDGLDVTLDANVPVNVMPEMSAERLQNTTFRLSDQVTLVKPPDDFEDDIVM